MDIDLHGYHPIEIDAADLVRQAWETGADRVTLIHGHGHKRGRSVGFVNTNTGFFGLQIRRQLRGSATELKQWAVVSSLDCTHDGSTTMRLRANAEPSRQKIELPPMSHCPQRGLR